MAVIRPLLFAGFALPVLASGVLSGQTLRGTVATPQGAPVPGALFTLLDESGRPVGTTVTNARGEFWFETANGGRYALQVERIGQPTFTGEPFTIDSEATLTLTLHVQSQPAGLGDVRAASARCGSGDLGGAVAAAWAHAAKALRIRLVAEQRGLLQVSGVRYMRLLDNAYRVRQGIIDEEPFIGPGMPFPLLPARRGCDSAAERSRPEAACPDKQAPAEAGPEFAALDSTGTLQYLVPSPAVLLSEAFLGHHCLHELVTDPKDDQRLALRFRPLPGSEQAGVAGTLWLDRSTADVELLEFEYRGAPGNSSREVRGLVDFATSPEGMPVVSRWWLRVPRVFETSRGEGERAERNTVLVESGGLAFGPDNQPIEDPEALFPLMTGVITLDAVVVQAKRTEFEAELEAKPWHWTRSATSVVRPAEILGAPQSSALDIVRALRAQWLVPAPGTTRQPSVYLDNMRLTQGRVSTEDALRGIPASTVGAIERIRSIEAAMLYGAIDVGANGVIVVYSRRW